MAEIFNKDVSVLGELTLNPSNSVGNIVTINGSGQVKFRTTAEMASDIGVATGSSDANYVHDQSIPALIWNIAHSLNKKPAVLVVDTADTVVIGKIEYIDNNNVKLTFNGSFSGYAYFN